MDNLMERRRSAFPERLSYVIVTIASLGAFWVLIDPQITGSLLGLTISLGTKSGFSPDLKGAIITSILVGGFSAVTGWVYGASKTQTNVPPPQPPEKPDAPPTP